MFVSRVKSFYMEQCARLALAYSILIPKVKLAIQGECFSDIQRGVTEMLKRVSLQDSTEVAQSIGWESKKVFEDKHKSALVKKKRKVSLIADSHAKRCAEKLACHLRNPCQVTGYVKPITGMEVGPGVAYWLRHCATTRTVLGSIPGGVTGFFSHVFLPTVPWPWG